MGSKDKLLFEIMNYGMDILDETVVSKVRQIADPRERLRRTIVGHIDLVVRTRDLEITVILHENRSLRGELRARINARKQEYIHLLEQMILEVRPKRFPRLRSARARGLRSAGNDESAVSMVPNWRSGKGGGDGGGLCQLLLPVGRSASKRSGS